ncbi:MAG: response regulator, partial [Campylobacterales bacterium]|nr:response regulator [Campylobacterales bacterium]
RSKTVTTGIVKRWNKKTCFTGLEKRVHYKNILEDIVSIIKFQSDKKGLKLEFDYDLKYYMFVGDPFRINQIITNLLTNAVKFTDKGSVVLKVYQEEDDFIRFEVKDTGIGLTKEQQNKLFNSFSQADKSISREYGGAGLGLSICKELIKLMDGRIWVESIYTEGSSFIFEITLLKASEDDTQNYKTFIDFFSVEFIKDTKILLVEDNKINQDIIIGLLQNDNLKIDIANDGQEALNMFFANDVDYDLILMDFQMQGMDGGEVSQQIRLQNQNIPIIILSANLRDELVDKLKNLKIDDFLSKPLDVEKFYNTLFKYLRVKKESIKQKKIDTKNKISAIENLGDEKLFIKIANNFYKTYRNINLMELNSGELERVTHSIYGLSKTLGYDELASLSKEIEETADRKLFDKFHHFLDLVIKDLEQYIELKEAKKFVIASKNSDEDLKKKFFVKLKEGLENRSSTDCRVAIEHIKNCGLNLEDEKIVKQIESLIDNRNYNTALDLLSL